MGMEKKKEGVSRQTLWQRKHRAMGLCVVCSEPAYKGWRCVKHYEQHKIVMRLRYIPRVRGRYDVGGSIDIADVAARRSRESGMMAGGPFGPLPIPAAMPQPAAVAARTKSSTKDGRTLQAKRNKTGAKTEKKAAPVRASAGARKKA
jgi:hypothetical protein